MSCQKVIQKSVVLVTSRHENLGFCTKQELITFAHFPPPSFLFQIEFKIFQDAPRLLETSQIDEVVVTNSVPHDTQKAQTAKIKTVHNESMTMSEIWCFVQDGHKWACFRARIFLGPIWHEFAQTCSLKQTGPNRFKWALFQADICNCPKIGPNRQKFYYLNG